MNTRRFITCTIAASLLALAGCASSALEEQKRKEMEADIDDILSYENDPAEVGEVKKCLSDIEYRSYRALGRRHLLFEGRRDMQWVNVLRGRCPGLNDNSIFIMKPSQSNSLCDKDMFNVVDRIDTLSRAVSGPACALGEFRPVTEAQVREIEERLEAR